MGKYKVGTISAILAKEGGGGDNEVDPKLAALFGGGGGAKVFKMVKVKEEEIGGGPRGKKKKEVTTEVTGDEGGKKKRKKKGKKGVQDGTISSTIEEVTMEEPVKKKKKKEGNVTKVTTEEDGGDVTKKDKNKKKKGVKLVTNGEVVKKSKKKGVKLDETGDDEEIVTKKDGKKKGVKLVTNGGDVKKKDKKKKGVKLEETGDDEEDDEEMTVDVPEKKEEVTKTLAEKNAPKPKDPELEARTIFVGNLPGLVEKKELKKLFKKWGQIETVRLRGGAPSKPTQLKKVAINKKELHKDKSTIMAYIRFATREEAEEAVKKGRGMILKDNHLVVDMAQGSGQGGDDGGKRDNKKAIFVGNLHLKVTNEELWRFFEPCGTITSVRVIRDNATGLGKGFGYVNFDSREAVDDAVKNLNQKELRGRSLRISRCVKKLKIKKHKGQKKTNGGDREETSGFGGDKMAEIGKLRRKSNKPNRGEMKKAKIAKLLTGKPPPNAPKSTWTPNRQRQRQPPQDKKRYFN